MATLVIRGTTDEKLALGERVLAASASVDATPVKQQVSAFRSVHTSLLKEHKRVALAEARITQTRERVAVLDVMLNESLVELSDAMVRDGHPRENPFHALDGMPLQALLECSPETRVLHARTLAQDVCAFETSSPATRHAARELENAAQDLESAQLPLAELWETYLQEIARRESLSQAWHTALQLLRRSARAAEDAGALNLWQTLFGNTGDAT